MKTSSDAPRFFAWEVRTFDHFNIPQSCWLKLKEVEKRGLSWLRTNRSGRSEYTYLLMVKNNLYLSDRNMNYPYLPPSKSFDKGEDNEMVKHIVRFAMDIYRNGEKYPAMFKITEEEAEAIYRANNEREKKLVKIILKNSPDNFGFSGYKP